MNGRAGKFIVKCKMFFNYCHSKSYRPNRSDNRISTMIRKTNRNIETINEFVNYFEIQSRKRSRIFCSALHQRNCLTPMFIKMIYSPFNVFVCCSTC